MNLFGTCYKINIVYISINVGSYFPGFSEVFRYLFMLKNKLKTSEVCDI
jgi:hypothetical protein